MLQFEEGIPGTSAQRKHLFSALQDIQVHSRFILVRNEMTLDRILRMFEHVTNMKRLLTELEQIECCMEKGGKAHCSTTNLLALYDELERMLRDARIRQNRKTKRIPRAKDLTGAIDPARTPQGTCPGENNRDCLYVSSA